VAAVAVVAVALVFGRAPEQPGGPPLSSYTTRPDGLAAYADLLARAGHDVRRIRAPLAEHAPPVDETLFVIGGAPLPRADREALQAFGARGGRLVRRGDGGILTNRALPIGDHAARALVLAGPPSRRVAFVESVHGFHERRGLGALPAAVRWCLWLLALAAAVFLLARGRRLGPPEAAARELPPPRRAHVDALAAALARVQDRPAAAAPVRAAAREALARRAGLGPAPDDAVLRVAAQRLGLPDDEVRAIAGDGGDLLATGRALAHLTATTTETT
jgi:hypothetical protein